MNFDFIIFFFLDLLIQMKMCKLLKHSPTNVHLSHRSLHLVKLYISFKYDCLILVSFDLV